MIETTLMGAGALPIHERCLLLQQRSASEEAPLVWSVFGGMREGGETPVETMVREVGEEAGIDVSGYSAWVLDEFNDASDGFRFYSFVVDLPERENPVHSVETEASAYFPLGDTPETLWENMPSPLHPGLALLMGKPEVTQRLFDHLEASPAPGRAI